MKNINQSMCCFLYFTENHNSTTRNRHHNSLGWDDWRGVMSDGIWKLNLTEFSNCRTDGRFIKLHGHEVDRAHTARTGKEWRRFKYNLPYIPKNCIRHNMNSVRLLKYPTWYPRPTFFPKLPQHYLTVSSTLILLRVLVSFGEQRWRRSRVAVRAPLLWTSPAWCVPNKHAWWAVTTCLEVMKFFRHKQNLCIWTMKILLTG